MTVEHIIGFCFQGMLDYIQQFIDQEIPIARKMGIQVNSYLPTRIALDIPLQANRNHLHTAFGGSIYSGLVLTGCCLLIGNLRANDLAGDVVIQRGQVEYYKPINDDFEVVCALVDMAQISSFLDRFARKGKAEIMLNSTIRVRNELLAEFTGKYVVLANR